MVYKPTYIWGPILYKPTIFGYPYGYGNLRISMSPSFKILLAERQLALRRKPFRRLLELAPRWFQAQKPQPVVKMSKS